MSAGGKRKGAGKPKGYRASHTIEAAKAREYLIGRISKELEPIVTAHIEAAKGMWIDDLDLNGERIKVYRKPPDLKAGEYLLNQGAGKPKENLDVTSGGEKIGGVEIKVRK
jgi:hypothetical protein